MEKIFIAGPLKVRKIDDIVKKRIDNIIDKKFDVLVGDANGVDKLVQEYLLEKNYKSVTVYCVENVRNNLGNWGINKIKLETNEKTFRTYTLKDFEMARDATYGYMIWNGKSNGTLNNVLNLLELNKKIILYLTTKKSFCNIKTITDLKTIINEFNKEDIDKIDKKIDLYKRLLKIEQKELSF